MKLRVKTHIKLFSCGLGDYGIMTIILFCENMKLDLGDSKNVPE